MMAEPGRTARVERAAYLGSGVEALGISLLLLALAIYQCVGSQDGFYTLLGVLLSLVAGALLFRAPRWLCYLLLGLTLVLSTYRGVLVDANGPQDLSADRDDDLETGAKALLAGSNPWEQHTFLNSQVTSGPASILLAAPFVGAFGRVNELTFLFWLGLIGLLLLGDLRTRNGSFLPLGLFYFLGQFELYYTQYWSLDSLYYPYLWLALAAVLPKGNRAVLLGAGLLSAALARMNYLFVAWACLLWFLLDGEEPARRGRALLVGAAASGALLLGPFVITSGVRAPLTFLRATLQVSLQGRPEGSLVALPARVSTALLGPFGGAALLALLGLGLIALLSLRLRRLGLDHPFWHMTAGGLVAHVLVWYPTRPRDYTLMFVLPALLAIAFTRGREGASS